MYIWQHSVIAQNYVELCIHNPEMLYLQIINFRQKLNAKRTKYAACQNNVASTYCLQ